MSRDFAPFHHWASYKNHPEIYTNNIKWTIGDKVSYQYTDEELDDRKSHIYMHVLGADIYKDVRKVLTDEKFEELNSLLGRLVDAAFKMEDLSQFPKEIVDWFFNANEHYYHEPNDEEFMEYLKKEWRQK